MSKREKLLNCYMDLQRAAVSLYRDPGDPSGNIFLSHALKILEEIKGKDVETTEIAIKKLKTQIFTNKSQYKNLADKILTVGLIIKPGD